MKVFEFYCVQKVHLCVCVLFSPVVLEKKTLNPCKVLEWLSVCVSMLFAVEQ